MSIDTSPEADAGALEDHWAKRIRAACDHVERCDEAAKLAHEARDELIVEALEQGWPSRAVARWARLSQPRVLGILARD